ncbi:insulinase family protein [Candidatus Kaiserbacteria bacterium]|nr:insulinase family protein [Candidatus Kaiserbacteria bacterium]
MPKIRTIFGVTEYRLSNGLRVLYKPERSAPVVAVCVTFHVGSRNEAPGHTGSTHILEHLLFKDSKLFNQKNGKAITGHLEWMGALVNATTWLDRTNYFELLPKERLEDALALEADRMRNSLFNDADLASEMTVVRNEYERGRNNPYELLDEEVTATAFSVHPYRIPTIGTKEDIEASTAAKLREFYDTFYWPNNATLSVFGDVSRAELERLVIKHFAKIPTSPSPIPTMDIVEPVQKTPRSCEIKKAAGVSIAILAYKTPQALHPDFAPIYVLATILAGGFSSRLQKKLVDRGLASDLSHMTLPTFDPGILTFTATSAEHVAPDKLVRLMRKEISDLVEKGVDAAEVDRARERILSSMAEERDGIFNEIRTVSESIAAGDWTLAYAFERTVKKITRTDVNRVAKKYLVRQGETTGILLDTVESPISDTATATYATQPTHYIDDDFEF